MELEALTTIADIGAYLRSCRAEINAPASLSDTASLLARNTALVDAVLRRLYALAQAPPPPILGEPDSVLTPPELGAGGPILPVAIVATGGYGRGELTPFSDIDITFVPAHEDDPALNALIKTLFQQMMDVFLYGANLKVGYAYRLLTDLGQLDHQTQTALLDSRFLCGDEALFKEFRSRFRSELLTADFLFRKWDERKAVLAKQGDDQVYGVEPNIKEGAGGLRDIQTAEWIGEVRFHAGRFRVWPTLEEHGFISQSDAGELAEARAALLRVRCALHLASGEAREVLTASRQEAVAALLGYTDTPDVPAVQAFMRDFYEQAATARRISRKAIRRCLASEIPMGLGLASVACSLIVTDPDVAMRDAAWPLHIAELAQAYDLEVSDTLQEAIANYLTVHPAPADPLLAGRVFTRLLTAGRAIADTLTRLAEWGVLAWLLPEFAPLMTLIPYDAAHDYTVGAHSLRVARNIENVKAGGDPRRAEFARALSETSFPEVLYLAALVHDLGKQWPEGDHAETGARTAELIAARLGWDSERQTKLVFLVRCHLSMSETSRLRDLALEETVRDFTRQVPDLDGLHMLYVLTYADTLAVGAGVWTEVHARFLSELYARAEAALSPPDLGMGGVAVTASGFDLARQRERIRKQLALKNLPTEVIHEHTRSLPAQYLLNTPLEEMYLHIAMINRLRETFQPIVDFRNEFGADYTEMTLCAYDDPRPGLLAKITGVLYAHDVNMLTAQVFTRDASVRIAIDTLWVDFRGRQLSSGKRAEVQESLRKILTGQGSLPELLEQKRKPEKDQEIYSARIDDQASERFSVLEISAPDEKGVVYRLTRAISRLGWNIHAARLSIWGSRARDAFYITTPGGAKVPEAEVARLLSALPSATAPRKFSPSGG